MANVAHGERDAPFQSVPTVESEAILQSSFDWRQAIKKAKLRCRDKIREQASTPSHKLTLVTGAPGSGKTRLITEAISGRCCKGKFDALRRPEPYRAFCAALTDWTKSCSQQHIAMTGEEVRILESLIPEIKGHLMVKDHDLELKEKCSGKESSAGRKKIQETVTETTTRRFGCVFRKLLRKIATEGDPVVLLFDDLQYADTFSLDLLGNLLADLNAGGLKSNLSIAASCNLDPPAPVNRFLSELRQLDRLTEIECKSLDEAEVADFLSSVFPDFGKEEMGKLSEIVQRQTNGNIGSIIEFARWLIDSQLIEFDEYSGSFRKWSSEKLRSPLQFADGGNFLRRRLSLQPGDLLDVLRVASCLGSQVDERLLGYVVGDTISRPVQAVLSEAYENDFFIRKRDSYEFASDCIQNAAYECIPEDEREVFHVSIGRRLWRNLGQSDELDRYVFVLLSQVSIGRHLVKEWNDRCGLSDLCLFAGRKAAKSSEFHSSLHFMNLGIELLGAEGWERKYDQTLALHNGAAEMSVCLADFEAMNVLVDAVKQNAVDFRDALQAENTQLYALGISGRQDDAIDLGLKILASLGETLPARKCHLHLVLEAISVKWFLRNKSDEQLLRLPSMTNSDKLVCIRTINLMVLYAMMFRPKLVPFLSLRMMKLTLHHGLSLMAPQAFSSFAVVMSGLGEFNHAARFGELSLRLLDELGQDESVPRVYAHYYGCVYTIRNPQKHALDKHLHGYLVGMQTGDFEFAFLNASMYCWGAQGLGVPLNEVDARWVQIQTEMKALGQQSLLEMGEPCFVISRHLMGRGEPCYQELSQRLGRSGSTMLAFFRGHQLKVYFVLNDRAGMRSIIDECVDLTNQIHISGDSAFHRWICSVVLLDLAVSRREKRKALRSSRKTVTLLKRLCSECPHNFLDYLNFIEAEISVLSGRPREAEIKYIQAIGLTRENENFFLEAISRERLARLYWTLGMTCSAFGFFHSSLSSYESWGAQTKVDLLRVEIDRLASGPRYERSAQTTELKDNSVETEATV